jgi:hypothetical protein
MCRTSIPVVALVVFLASAGVAAPPASLDKDPNLVAWWTFDETAGKTVADSSRHKRNGTLEGDAALDKCSAPGKVGKAVRFDGEDTVVTVKGYKGVKGTRPRTVAVWTKTNRGRGRIISWGTDDFGQMFNLGHIRGRIGVTPNGGYLYMNEETDDDQWHHVAVVVQEAELPNLHDDVKLYLDGVPAEIHDIGLLDLWPIETGDEMDVRIGQGYRGLLDDLRIYDRALTDEEINAIYRLQTNRPLKQ